MWIDTQNIRVNKKQLKKIDKKKVENHRKSFEMGIEVMPIDVVKIDENEYVINGNGRHRFFGAIAAGFTMIDVNIID